MIYLVLDDERAFDPYPWWVGYKGATAQPWRLPVPIIKALVTIPMDTNLPEDAVVNTFHFYGTVPTSEGDKAALVTALSDFYSTNGPSGFKVAQYLSTKVQQTGNVRFYDMSEAKPRAPFHEASITIASPTTGDNLPEEVALCVSFQAPEMSGVNQARRRGRIYIGPLYSGAITQPSARPADNFRTACKEAADRLATGPIGTTDLVWGVYSPATNPSGTGTSGFATITEGWVDNAWDTQRRRGLAPTVRDTWSV